MNLTEEARRLGCMDQLVIELVNRIDRMEAVLKSISTSPSLHQCQTAANEMLKEIEDDA